LLKQAPFTELYICAVITENKERRVDPYHGRVERCGLWCKW